MGRWAQRRRAGTSTLPAAALLVLSVQKTAGNTLLWTFNGPLTSNGSASTQLQDATLSSSGNPIGTTQANANAVTCTYSVTPSVGNTWQITSTPTNLTNPTGSGIKVPQSGTVT